MSSIEEKFLTIQKKLELDLDTIRKSFKHPGNKGTNVEETIRKFLREYLPTYNRIGQGEVIDSLGNNSNQIDIIITNQEHPFLNDLNSASIFFIEGVACAGEVKAVLTSQELNNSLNNCLAFKKLEIKLRKGVLAYSTKSDANRFINKRPYFIFAFESQLSMDTVLSKIKEFNETNNLPLNEQVDSVFILSRGAIINFGDGQGSLQFKTPKGNSLEGYSIILKENDEKILFNFLGWINTVIPKVTFNYPIMAEYLFKK